MHTHTNEETDRIAGVHTHTQAWEKKQDAIIDAASLRSHRRERERDREGERNGSGRGGGGMESEQ